MVLRGLRPDCFMESVVETPNRFKNGDWNRRVSWFRRGKEPPQAGQNREKLIGGPDQDHGEDDGEDDRAHSASSATPHATKPTPAQRRPSTTSFSRNLAAMVSTTKLAAVTGTAKLRSANVSSFMKAKNETAMKNTATTR